MRILLDENMHPDLVALLHARGHEVDHVALLGLAGSTDSEVARIAAAYDLLITFDLYRDQNEWFEIGRALLASIRILRIRLRPRQRGDFAEQSTALLRRWTYIENLLLESEVRLLTVSAGGTGVRALSAAQVAALLRTRPERSCARGGPSAVLRFRTVRDCLGTGARRVAATARSPRCWRFTTR